MPLTVVSRGERGPDSENGCSQGSSAGAVTGRLVVAEVAGEGGEALAELGYDGTHGVELGADSFVACLECVLSGKEPIARVEEETDTIRREVVAHGERPPESFDLVRREFHRRHPIEQVFVLPDGFRCNR